MQKIYKLVAILVILVSLFSLTSCGFYWRFPDLKHRGFPENYTGGWGQDYYGHDYEYFWVESYDEVLVAIEKLKSHGSSFKDSVIFDYEGDLLDVKYCFSFGENDRDLIRYGEDPFDRYASNVGIFAVAFAETVSIDELMVSMVEKYEHYRLVSTGFEKESLNVNSLKAELVDNTPYSWVDNPTGDYRYYLYNEENELVLSVFYTAKFQQTNKPSEECIDAVLNSIKILDLNKTN